MRAVVVMLGMGLAVAGPAVLAADLDSLASFSRAAEQAVSPLVVARDGQLYGTSAGGGAHGLGTVYRVSPQGSLSILRSFQGGVDGAGPDSGLVEAEDGVFYGASSAGGAGGFGTLFKITSNGVFTPLVSFTGTAGPARGAVPGGLVRHSDGAFYGVTAAGGTHGLGTVFQMTPAGVVTTLVEFTGTGGAARGAAPVGPLTLSGGVLYGVTQSGGSADLGTIFRVTTAGSWSLMAEFTGTGGSHPGAHPAGSLRMPPDGALYGTTEFGGTHDFGTCFRITTAPSPVFSSVRSFADPSGSQPTGRLEIDGSGTLYGVTAAGGTGGLGTIYKLTSAGSHTVLTHFSGASGGTPGAAPRGGLVTGVDGAYYTATSAGGPGQLGGVCRVTAAGAFGVVASFSPIVGWRPSGAPVVTASGELLFPLAAGGAGGSGVLVRLPVDGVPAVAASLDETVGSEPTGGLVAAGDSWMGVAAGSGGSGRGTAFRYTPGAGVGLLSSFTTTGGSLAEGPLLAGLAGDFFGVAREGGLAGHGTVFRLTTSGARTRVVSFTGTSGAARGRRPRGPLALAGVNYFGMTEQGGSANAGTVFRVSPAGVLTTLADFTTSGPREPHGGLVAGGDGFLYGTTSLGGTADGGTLVRVDPATNTWAAVAAFTSATGLRPAGPLLAWNGALFGLATSGGEAGFGTVFRYTATDGLSALVSFTGLGGSFPGWPVADSGGGSEVAGGLVGGPDGHLYGVTAGGGAGGGGTAFRIRLGSDTPPFDAWKSAELGAPGLPDSADPDADGLPILLEYALHLQPDHPDANGIPTPSLKAYGDGDRLHLVLTRDPQRSDVSLLVQAAHDLSGPWETVADSLHGAPFSGPGYVSGDAATPGLKTVEVRDTQPMAAAVRRFMRLKINH